MAWVVAHEGKGLDFVLEVLHRGDRDKDLVENVAFYARLGIPEYFVYDRAQQRIYGYCLPDAAAKHYQRIVPRSGRHRSAVLGLDLAIQGGTLRFFHGMAELFGTEDLIGRLTGMVEDLEAKAYSAIAEADAAVAALRSSVLAALEIRGIPRPDDIRAHLSACDDPMTLQRWLLRAMTAATVAEVFTELA